MRPQAKHWLAEQDWAPRDHGARESVLREVNVLLKSALTYRDAEWIRAIEALRPNLGPVVDSLLRRIRLEEVAGE